MPPLTPAAATMTLPHTSGGANKNPRMGYTIGYLRKSEQPPKTAASHEYASISDDDFGLGSLDLGPSLMDEVFSELDSSREEPPEKGEPEKEVAGNKPEQQQQQTLKELVSRDGIHQIVIKTFIRILIPVSTTYFISA
jgi:hypothetical protein